MGKDRGEKEMRTNQFVGGGDQNKIPKEMKLNKHKLFFVYFSHTLNPDGGSWQYIIAESLDEALTKAKSLHKHHKIENVKEIGDCYI